MDTIVAAPGLSGDFAADVAAFSAYWRTKPGKQTARDARFAFLRRHARTLYDKLTDNRRKFVRIERLVYDAAARDQGGGVVDQPLDAHELASVIRQLVVERAGVATQEGEAGVACRLLAGLGPPVGREGGDIRCEIAAQPRRRNDRVHAAAS